MEDVSLFEDRALALKDMSYREYAAWCIAGLVSFAYEVNSGGQGGYMRDGKMHAALRDVHARHLPQYPVIAGCAKWFEYVFILQFADESRIVPANPWEFSDSCDLWVSRDHRCVQDGVNWRDFNIEGIPLVEIYRTKESGGYNKITRNARRFIPRFDDFCPFKYELHKCGILDEGKLDINERYRR